MRSQAGPANPRGAGFCVQLKRAMSLVVVVVIFFFFFGLSVMISIVDTIVAISFKLPAVPFVPWAPEPKHSLPDVCPPQDVAGTQHPHATITGDS